METQPIAPRKDSPFPRMAGRPAASWLDLVTYIDEEDKLTLRAIEQRYHLSTDAVAAIASIEPRLVYLMEQGGALEKKDAQKILRRLSEVTGQDYSLETVGGYWIKGLY